VSWRVFGEPSDVSKDNVPATRDEVQYWAEATSVFRMYMVLPADLHNLALALHMERFQTLCVSGKYGPCFTGVKKNGYTRIFVGEERYRSVQT